MIIHNAAGVATLSSAELMFDTDTSPVAEDREILSVTSLFDASLLNSVISKLTATQSECILAVDSLYILFLNVSCHVCHFIF